MNDTEVKLSPIQQVEWWLLCGLRRLPTPWVSAVGAWLGERNARRGIAAGRLWVDRLHRNFAHDAGEQDPKRREAMIVQYMRNLGRVYAEISILQRMVAEGRVEVTGLENLQSAQKPVILASCHLANWELIGHVAAMVEGGGADLYAPLSNPVHQKMVLQMRKRWPVKGKTALIAAGGNAMRQLSRMLAEGNGLILFIDEERDGYVHAPSLGRDIPLSGNRWFTARLAARHDATVVPVHVEPSGRAQYRIVIGKPLLAEGKDHHERAFSLASQLDAYFDPLVQKYVSHWYWYSLFERNAPQPAGNVLT